MSETTPTGKLIFLVDTETIGKDAGPDRLVELAVLPVFVPDVNKPCQIEIRYNEAFGSLVKPGEPISFGAMATHHVTEEMVADAEPLSTVMAKSPLGRLEQWPPVLVAHNAEFDAGFLKDALAAVRPAGEVTEPYWLDTLRCAKHLLPESQGFSNQSLRYEYKLEHPELAPGGAHRATSDALVTALLLGRLLQMRSLRSLCGLQGEPVLLRQYGFGKHRGEPLANLPDDYLRWVAYRSDLGLDEKHTAEHEIARRRTEGRQDKPGRSPRLGESISEVPMDEIPMTTGLKGVERPANLQEK